MKQKRLYYNRNIKINNVNTINMSKLTTPVTSIISVIQAWIVKYVIKVKFGGLHTLFTFVQKRRKKHSCSNILFHFWILILLCSLCKNFFVLTLNRMCKCWLVFDYMDLWSYLGLNQQNRLLFHRTSLLTLYVSVYKTNIYW